MTRRSVGRLVVGALVAVATGSVFGQQPTISFKSGVEAVTVTISVRDSRGRVVRDLKKADFEVIDSGERRQIQDFYAGDSPVSLAVLLDISGSMSVGGNMDRAREAVSVAMTNLRNGSDEAALFTFDSTLQDVIPFTHDLDRIRRVSLEGKPWGTTLLYDAIAQTAKTVAARTNKHRAVLVITDGVDTGSRMAAPDVSRIASEIDVPVYLLTVVTPVDHLGGEFAVTPPHRAGVRGGDPGTGADGGASGIATLADLARWTGGDLRIASEPMHTLEAIRDLFLEMRHQYVITFEPGARPGWHPLEIRTRKKNHVVHARSGYVSGPSRVSS